MKYKNLLLIYIPFFLSLSLNMVQAENTNDTPRNYYIPANTEELEGTWINQNDPWGNTEQKLIYTWWGYFEVYTFKDDEKPSGRGTSTIVDKWTDNEGNIWYKEFYRGDWSSRTVYFRLIKLSNNASKWESVQSTVDFPTQKDLSAENRWAMGYRIFLGNVLKPCCN